jgi:hypothetical protein
MDDAGGYVAVWLRLKPLSYTPKDGYDGKFVYVFYDILKNYQDFF